MSSILTNASALSALQSLTQTQSALQTTESQVSTGLAVSTAADNASYWSIAAQLNSDSGVVTASNQALSQSQAVLSTASSAIESVTSTIAQIETALTQASNPGADLGAIETTLNGLGTQLLSIVNGASFNGLNVLNNSTLTTGGTTGTLAFVSGFNATATGGSVNTITLTTQALINGGTVGTDTTPGTTGTGILDGGTTGGVDLLNLGNTIAAAYATPTTGDSAATSAAAAANTALGEVSTVLNAVTTYAATIGATQDAMTAASTFNSALTTDYATGVSALVDADMNTASTRLQALQTQEQLGIQSLSIANQNSQLILKLFS
jgi:flagellin